MDKMISVVVSVYNEELVLHEFYQETGKVLRALPENWDYEILFVNDGSQDKSLAILRELAEQDEKVRQRERKIQSAVIDIKKKHGKNAIIKGMNLEEGATAKDRNAQIGVHKA